MKTLPILFSLAMLPLLSPARDPVSVSGVFPHLRMWNQHGEAGTGAVVVWQGDLWAITYAPHMPSGSTDKLYQITPDLEQRIFEGSVGGTPANRMIHRETNQLLIGPYLIDREKQIRTIPPEVMFGRLTGNARHLTQPETHVYYATMEEGLYEVDLRTLEVKCLIRDGNSGAPENGIPSELPGYHGKGLYSSQGRLVYANNGDRDPKVRVDPTVPSGALAEWRGSGDWALVRRNQFTEVTGPGGIPGNDRPATDVIWSMGWDEKSLLLALLEEGEWYFYRLPKGSHSYDGAHGWNTEWPRIREIGETALLATMHGTFWHFPPTFSRRNSSGIAPRSNYLKVIGDFCRWGDKVVLGCDDSAKAEFLNTRPFKAEHGAPLQSNSNLWFITPEQLDQLGPVIGRGSVWLREDLEKDSVSDPYLFSGYDHRQLHLAHRHHSPLSFEVEIDRDGTGEWNSHLSLTVPPGEPVSHLFSPDLPGTWIRLRSREKGTGVTAHFQYRDRDPRETTNDGIFRGLTPAGKKPATTGVMRSLAYDRLGLVAAEDAGSSDFHYYEISPTLELVPVDAPDTARKLVKDVRQPTRSIREDGASVLLIEDGKRYRLPLHPDYVTPPKQADEPAEKTLQDYLPESLLIDAEVAASSTHSHYVAGKANDGIFDEESRWIGRNGRENTIEFSLAEEKAIQSLWIVSGWKTESQYVARDFDVERWADGAWEPVPEGSIRENHEVERELRFDPPLTTTKIRLRSRNKDFFRLYEVAAFSVAPEIQPVEPEGLGPARICREVATERDLLNVHGTFYELPARNAQGLAKVRPIATHHLAIQDFCSHNGLLFFTGVDSETESGHIFRSRDGKAAVWAGVIDDLWKLGKPRGSGGPWKNTGVKAGEASDPYLMTGYDRKSFSLHSTEATTIRLEVDVDGTGLWIPFESFFLAGDEEITGTFPEGFSAYWVRAISSAESTVTARFDYE